MRSLEITVCHMQLRLLMKIQAASTEEVEFGLDELKRGQAILKTKLSSVKFNRSILFPRQISEVKSHGKAPYVCAACGSVITKRPTPNCGKCKVTYYCNRECQVYHWKFGGTKRCVVKQQLMRLPYE